MEKKKIKIVSYDPNWPKIFKIYEQKIKNALNTNIIKIYHIGSTSISDMYAKPKIDIMCVVKNFKNINKSLEIIGFSNRGEFRHLPLRLFFSKRGKHNINLHIVKENNGEIAKAIYFRDYLRKHKYARDLYSKIKLKLIEENQDGFELVQNQNFTNYTTQKTSFIMDILKKSGFNSYILMEAIEQNEIRSFQNFLGLNEINTKNPNIFNLCLYKGTTIKAGIILEFFDNGSKTKIKKIYGLNDKYTTILMDKIHEWLEFRKSFLIN